MYTGFIYRHWIINDKYEEKSYIGQIYSTHDGYVKSPHERWRLDGKGYETKSEDSISKFWRAICKYGWDNFQHDILLKIECDALEEPVKSGKSKQLQLKRWKEYFNWDKIGNKYIITEIKNLTPVVSNYYINLIRDNCDNFQESETLSMYDSIINQIQGNSLRDLIAKSIINNLYLELTELGQVGFRDAWFVTDAELLIDLLLLEEKIM